MGNIACVPQAPGGFRSSFRRKPSLKKEQNGKKKLPSFFGLDGGQERDTTTDKILQYIPAKIIQKQENQKENLDQRFPSLFKKGRRNTVVRNLGKMIYYSKVKFKFQHCQEIHSCFLELFQSYLYFQSTGPNGLTYQGLLPLKELQVQELGAGQSPGQQEHALHISGPLLNPLVVFCQSEAELKQWLYHLEKQIQLCGGSLALPLLPQSPGDKEELRWSVQNLPVQDWRGSQRESLGEILCLSKVKLQHLPFQEQHERLLVLYPSTLVIVSKERGGLCFKGELPLNAIQVLFEENDKSSFLIEGRLINSIRVTCASYQDYQEWLYCLKTAQFRNADSSFSGSESFSVGPKPPQPCQFPSSVRGSLSSDGRTNSWASGGRVTALTQLCPASGSLPDGPSFLLSPESRRLQEPLCPAYCQPLHFLQCHGQPGAAQGAVPGAQQLSLEPWHCQPLPGHCREVPTGPTYSSPGTSRRLQLRAPAQGSCLGEICSVPQEHLGPELRPPDGPYALADASCPCRDSTLYHDYAELQSFQSDLSYDNLWEAEEQEPGSPHVFQV
ncbi:pleckstrin homology domain-containing family N member 1 isoform X2 [Camarhynchus parvulus]|uniref:pleckstrin homology domain-containing family N member 1 isoform X2 n=1 Tax=Geospiza parvula TaxID=87175 RepID=UPI001237E8A8|nr:pleckstrin homology domain-containing family N member 1 isoform X2 [Camarhynchus parvulus]